MRLFHWLRHRTRPSGTFRPSVQLLEDRTVPTGWGWHSWGWHSAPPPASEASGPATHLQVVVPEYVTTGQSFKVLLEAEDAADEPATGYTGSVSLALGTADTGATVPAAYTFTTADHGFHWFTVTLASTISQTITATGTLNTATITGSATTTVNAAGVTTSPTPVATSVVVITPETAVTGTPERVDVEVLDQAGHRLQNYTGTVTLSSSDTTATGTSARNTAATPLPLTYTFTAPNRGEHAFWVTFNETAAATGTATTIKAVATTATTATLSDTGTVTVSPATAVTHFAIFTRRDAMSGTATAVYVTALNAANQVVTGYTGTVSFTSTDTTAEVSATEGGTAAALKGFTYPFTMTDAGTHVFYFTFGTTGDQTLTVSDTSNASATGTASVDVVAQLPTHGGGGWGGGGYGGGGWGGHGGGGFGGGGFGHRGHGF